MVYQRALGGDIIAAIFYLKAQRPKFRDRLNINVEQVQSDIKDALERIRANPEFMQGQFPAVRMALKAAEGEEFGGHRTQLQ